MFFFYFFPPEFPFNSNEINIRIWIFFGINLSFLFRNWVVFRMRNEIFGRMCFDDLLYWVAWTLTLFSIVIFMRLSLILNPFLSSIDFFVLSTRQTSETSILSSLKGQQFPTTPPFNFLNFLKAICHLPPSHTSSKISNLLHYKRHKAPK